MATQINGKLYRNVKNASEGIETNSLKVNDVSMDVLATGASNKGKYLHTNSSTGALEWSAVSGGGTQLYKHTITINADYGDDDPYEETLIFINKSSTSLVGKSMYEITDYIAGFFVENADTEDESMCSIIAKLVYSDSIIYYSTYSNQITDNSQWTGTVLTDSVTTL